ncbi:S-adenosyl-L-homocysteine hydrolase [Desulfonispora thiosulfatigenes DSM 11270]|uniref:S-adenosyl-L-homocysteine hydrolase n=1 Tax=Desulfonispora thiosulfatigenes DSM 11270 TaxID=656914 RepID=A0A1W1VMH0_DESTI|nr:S-adenosyl-L-homocysteine hydrolase [Desulfonispora thiosulfatigenes DSM 11270]
MDMTFALQALSLEYMLNDTTLTGKVYNVPEIIDKKVATIKLNSLGVEIDELTEEQNVYLNSWQI